jgi:transcription antitermination factor NusA-like protein
VQSVVQELRGEKIDIVPYVDDQAKYVCNALSPAKVNRVFVDEDNHAMLAIVPDDQLSLAIGRNGQNVRLAVKLTGWKIDVKSEAVASADEAGENNEVNSSLAAAELIFKEDAPVTDPAAELIFKEDVPATSPAAE